MELYRSKGTNAMVLGIVSCGLALLGVFALPGLVCGIIGLVMAAKVRKAGRLEEFELDGNSKAAYVLNIVGVCINGVEMLVTVVALVLFASLLAGSAAVIGAGALEMAPEIMEQIPAIIESIPVP